MRSSCGSRRKMRRGFMFSFDAGMGVVIAILIIYLASDYLSRYEQDPLPKLHSVRLGADLVTMLDYNNSFSSLNPAEWEEEMDTLLPKKYNMTLNVTLANGSYYNTSHVPPPDRFIGTGSKFTVITNDSGVEQAALVSFKIWEK